MYICKRIKKEKNIQKFNRNIRKIFSEKYLRIYNAELLFVIYYLCIIIMNYKYIIYQFINIFPAKLLVSDYQF